MNAPKPSRQLMTEAVLLFSDSGITTEMLYPEFEAVLDNIVSMPERADQQVRAAYITINPRLQVRAIVLFYLDIDEQGSADPGWNIPLRQLVEKAEYGPDLGGGPVRLVCRSQTPVPWLQMHLWDPDMSPGHNHLAMIRDCVRRNQLRLLTEEEFPPAASVLELDRLQVAAEEAWQLPSEVARKKKLEQDNLEREQEQRKKAAQLIKQQRLRIRSLEAEHDQAIARLQLQADSQLATMRQNIQELERALQQQNEHNQQLLKQVEQLASIGNEARNRLQNVAAQEQNQIAALRSEFDQQLQSHKALLASTLQEQQQQLQQRYAAQLAEQQSQLQKAQQDTQTLHQEYKHMLAESQSVLHRLDEAGVSLVTMQPGAGHITIPVNEVHEFLKSPHAFAAKYCMVSEEAYKTWLEHYESPACDALIPVTGEACGLPLERKTHPGRFTPGISNRCSRHKELW